MALQGKEDAMPVVNEDANEDDARWNVCPCAKTPAWNMHRPARPNPFGGARPADDKLKARMQYSY
eukprot:315302-Amphidinium_carterae.2